MAWFAIYTHSRAEKKVATALEKAGVQAYCPLVKRKRQWSDRVKWIDEPLFRSYVFVNIDLGKDSPKVRKVPGVVNFVYWLGKPAPIQDEEMEGIRLFVTKYFDVDVVGASVKIGDKVTLNTGIFKGKRAEIISFKNKNEVRLRLESLGFELVAKIQQNEAVLK